MTDTVTNKSSNRRIDQPYSTVGPRNTLERLAKYDGSVRTAESCYALAAVALDILDELGEIRDRLSARS